MALFGGDSLGGVGWLAIVYNVNPAWMSTPILCGLFGRVHFSSLSSLFKRSLWGWWFFWVPILVLKATWIKGFPPIQEANQTKDMCGTSNVDGWQYLKCLAIRTHVPWTITSSWPMSTVDGRSPAPVDREVIPVFKRSLKSQVVQDFFHQHYLTCPPPN